MKTVATSTFLGTLLLPLAANAAPPQPRDVDTKYPYTGPKVPVGDWVDQTINGNGKGFPRLVEPPAVKPASSKPTNNINVISVTYLPDGVQVHYETPFKLGGNGNPTVNWGTSASSLTHKATGHTTTYDRTPPCSEAHLLQCNQFFHNVKITGLKADTTYYYEIPASGGTTKSDVLSFKTARAAGDDSSFTMAILNDMGYTNAMGTHKQLINAVGEGLSFAWHGGDISYADDWYSGILPCSDDWPVCYNGSSSKTPGPAPVPAFYKDTPLPKGEVADQGGPNGGDFNVIYESNWDLWQQWMNAITTKIPYMTLPGNHEAACAEFDGGNNTLTAYLNDDKANSSAPKSDLTYYSCPPSQRNFTAFQHRFKGPGAESGGVGNFWYSFDFGSVHFVAIDTETDYAYSPEYPFIRDSEGKGHPTEQETYVTDSGPFGYIKDGKYNDNSAYEQVNWLQKDLAAVNRTATPWVLVMGHRPMYSSQTSSYQANIREAFEDIMIDNGVDVYLAGHIHWYERMHSLGKNGTINKAAMVDKDTYHTASGTSMLHIINGMAGNIESHSTLEGDPVLDITVVLNYVDYGFNKVTVDGAKSLTFEYTKGDGSGVGDKVTLLKGSSKRSTLGYE